MIDQKLVSELASAGLLNSFNEIQTIETLGTLGTVESYKIVTTITFEKDAKYNSNYGGLYSIPITDSFIDSNILIKEDNQEGVVNTLFHYSVIPVIAIFAFSFLELKVFSVLDTLTKRTQNTLGIDFWIVGVLFLILLSVLSGRIIKRSIQKTSIAIENTEFEKIFDIVSNDSIGSRSVLTTSRIGSFVSRHKRFETTYKLIRFLYTKNTIYLSIQFSNDGSLDKKIMDLLPHVVKLIKELNFIK